MFAETESEELLNLLSQVRLVADEEARTDEQQQQQQLNQSYSDARCGLKPTSSPSTLSISTAVNTATTAESMRTAFSSTSAGRYTASSTAAVDWTVHDSTGEQKAGQQLFHEAAAAGRTPATGAKVLRQGPMSPHDVDTLAGSGDTFEKNSEDLLHSPNQQLFFTNAHKRSVLHRQQQQQLQEEQSRSATATADPTPKAFTESTSAVLDSAASSAEYGHAFPRTTSRDGVTSPGSAAVMSTVLSGYAQPLSHLQQDGQQDHNSKSHSHSEPEGGADESRFDGLSRIAAELERAAADDDNGDIGGVGDVTAGSGTAVRGVDLNEQTALSDLWSPARGGIGTPHSLLDHTTRSPFTCEQHKQQLQQQVTPANTPSFSVSSAAFSPLFATSTYVDPHAARATATTPLTMVPPAVPRTRQREQSNVSPPASTSAEAVVADFFRANSAVPDSRAEVNVYYGDQSRHEAHCPGDTGGALENEAAWRLSVEAELNELQRAGLLSEPAAMATNNSSNSANNSSAMQKYATPTTTISPLTPASTTPYHQLLSQLRYSPQQQQQQQQQGMSGARANTPPERRAGSTTTFTTTTAPVGTSVLHRAASDVSAATANAHTTMGALNVGQGAATTARYTANITRVSPFTAGGGGGGSVQANQGRSWPQVTSPSVEAAALWERMSPYEKASAATAAGAFAGARTALLHTPDTVAKPVTLSSIAAHLQGEDVTAPDELAYYRQALPTPTSLAQQQQQQRYPSPPAFTTAAAAPPASLLGRPGSSARLSDSSLTNGASNTLFPSAQSPQQQQQQPPPMMMMQTPSGTPAGQGQGHGWPKQPPQQQQQQAASAYAQAAPSRTAAMTASTAAAPQRSMRPQQQQQLRSPTGLRRGTPDETTSNPNNNNNNNSPPSCSLRPSPQMRASDGTSPALRRYVITTPNTRASTAAAATGNHNNNNNSASRRSSGGSPLGQYGGAGGMNSASSNNSAGAAREARPRVQLSHLSNAAALRSPLHYNNSSATAAAAGFTSPVNTAYGAAAVGSGMAPPYHGHGPNMNGGVGGAVSTAVGGGGPYMNNSTGNGTAVGGYNAVAGGSAATSVSPIAVRVLIERLQAAAPVVLCDGAAEASPAADSFATLCQTNGSTGTNNKSGSSNSGGGGVNVMIPEVASASAILVMSHDQHGCRLLQAVLDAECDNAMGDVVDGEEKGDADANEPGSHHSNSRHGHHPYNQSGSGPAERRRQRRAEAFYHSTAVQVILRAIEPKLDAVMADGYGNFLLQKVFDMAPDAERQRLLRLPSLQQHLCEVACSPHGTFAVQRLVETVRNTEEERLVFIALERDLLRLLTNANGGHVLMKVMECIRRQLTSLAASGGESAPAGANNNNNNSSTTAQQSGGNGAQLSLPLRSLLQDRVDTLFTAIQQNLVYVCQHKQGCCIMQKCLDFLNACAGLSPNTSATAATSPAGRGRKEEEKEEQPAAAAAATTGGAQPSSMDYFDRMSALLLPHVQELSVHPFGNYVVTRLVDVCYARGSTATIDAIATVMQSDLVRMCTNKFASNVVEHILRHCSERRIRSICQALMVKSTGEGKAATDPMTAVSPAVAHLPLTTVVMDSYGNYVVQTLLTVAPVDELACETSVEGGMLPVLQQLLPLLSSRNFGRKLETKTELALLRVEQYHQQQRRM